MIDTMSRYLGVFEVRLRSALRACLLPQIDRTSTQMLVSAALAIQGGGSAGAKTGGSDAYACVQGQIVKLAASTNMPALTGLNAAQNQFLAALFFMDGAAALTVAGALATTVANTAAGLRSLYWPQFPQGKALVGMALIINTGGAFTGGTTALDTATTVYINGIGDFDPTVLV